MPEAGRWRAQRSVPDRSARLQVRSCVAAVSWGRRTELPESGSSRRDEGLLYRLDQSFERRTHRSRQRAWVGNKQPGGSRICAQ